MFLLPTIRPVLARATVALTAAIALLAAAAAPAQTLRSFSEPYETVLVAAPESGIVDSLAVREGDRVAQGQTIASLDNQVHQASLASAQVRADSQGKLAAAQVAFDIRHRRVEKFRSLRLEGHASPEEVEQAQADLAIAEANLIAAREELREYQLEADRIRVAIERRVIRSPIDGVVLRLHKAAGESVGPGDAEVATIVQLTALRVTLYLPTSRAVSLEPDKAIPLTFAESGARANGRVEFISPVTDSDSGTVRVVVVIDNPPGQYRSGVRCDLQQ
jgi:RND family efflux transporter MFP subunit